MRTRELLSFIEMDILLANEKNSCYGISNMLNIVRQF